MSARKTGRLWYLGIVAVVAAVVTAVLLSLQPAPGPIWLLIRAAGLLGYQAMFFAVLSLLFMRQMLRYFGRPFLRVHHILTLTGLALILVHPIAVAVAMNTLGRFVPQVGSLRLFLQFGGAPSLYVFIVAALVAYFREPIGKHWRTLHLLTYVAYFLATTHALLLGPNIQYPLVRAVVILMALAVAFVLVWRRVQASRRKSGRQPARRK